MRINKFLTVGNFCSRRQADELIKEGRVKINDRIANLGDQVKTGDKVFADKKEVRLNQKKVYLAYNKPVGVITTTDKRAKDNIIFKINYPVRVYPVGRLDVNTSGLILLTNDGSVVNKILKGREKVEKEYEVIVDKKITKGFLTALEQGVILEGHKTLPAKIRRLSDKKFSIVIVEGKNRQVRRMVSKFGFEVSKLKRVRIGGLKLENLDIAENEHIELSGKVIKEKILNFK